MPSYPTYGGDQMTSVNTSVPLDTIPEADLSGWMRYIQQWVKGTFDVAHNLNGTLKSLIVATGMIADAAITVAKLGFPTFIQRVRTEITSTTGVTAETPSDNSIPQNADGEGTLMASAAITPSNAANKIILRFNLNGRLTGASNVCVFFCKDSDLNAIAAATFEKGANGDTHTFLEREVSAGSTSARTYKARLGTFTNNGTFTPNVGADGDTLGGVVAGFFEAIEWKP